MTISMRSTTYPYKRLKGVSPITSLEIDLKGHNTLCSSSTQFPPNAVNLVRSPCNRVLFAFFVLAIRRQMTHYGELLLYM